MSRTRPRWTVVVALLAVIGFGAWAGARAQTPPIETDDTRFTFHRVDDGYLRLDGRSGAVSLCSQRPAGWLCQIVPDERSALEAEIARLQTDNAALKKELLAHNLALPGGIRPDPPGKNGERLQLPSDAELDRLMAFMEKVWRRLVDMIVTAQRDMLRKS